MFFKFKKLFFVFKNKKKKLFSKIIGLAPTSLILWFFFFNKVDNMEFLYQMCDRKMVVR